MKVVSFGDIVVVTFCDCLLNANSTSGDIAVVSLGDMKVVSFGDSVIIDIAIVSLGDIKVVSIEDIVMVTSCDCFIILQSVHLGT